MDKDQLELFNAWFYRAKHRAKYTDDHPAYLAAQEAWEAWLDAPDTPPRQSRSDVKPLTEAHKQPAQQEAQIVRWKCPCGNEVTFRGFTEAPASKTWVGLTDEERDEIYNTHEPYADLKAVEAKLQEKNGF